MGDSVIWINDGGYHDVNGNNKLNANQPYNNPVTFDSPTTNTTGEPLPINLLSSTYNYDCSVGSHAASGMVSTIVVQPITPNALILWLWAPLFLLVLTHILVVAAMEGYNDDCKSKYFRFDFIRIRVCY